jgi:hypothetical protein
MKSFSILLGAAVSLLSAAALAADPNYYENRDPVPPADPYAAPAPAPAAHPDPMADLNQPDKKYVGIDVEAGGGVGGFIDRNITSVTTAQGQWTGRMVFGTRSHFAGEAAYVGSAQKVNTVGISPNATLVGNGAEAAFRLNVLTGMWQPYAIAGIGWTHYSLGNATLTTSDVQSSGDVATFPLGVGMAWRYSGFVLDGRFSFHPATKSGLIRETNLSTWDLQAKAGFEF